MGLIWAFIKPFLPQLLIGALLIGAVAYIDHRGYVRGEAAAEARFAKAEAAAASRQAKMTKAIADAIEKIDADLGRKLADNDSAGREAQTIIQKEIAANPRLSDSSCALTPAMIDAINKVRAQSHD